MYSLISLWVVEIYQTQNIDIVTTRNISIINIRGFTVLIITDKRNIYIYIPDRWLWAVCFIFISRIHFISNSFFLLCISHLHYFPSINAVKFQLCLFRCCSLYNASPCRSIFQSLQNFTSILLTMVQLFLVFHQM